MAGDGHGKRNAGARAARPAAPGTVRGTHRMEAFTDGVFAIAILTLLYLLPPPTPIYIGDDGTAG